jgi:hypothetical protein
MSKKRKQMSKTDKLLVETHNNLEEGLNMKIARSKQKGFTDTPLFQQNQQTDLFTK